MVFLDKHSVLYLFSYYTFSSILRHLNILVVELCPATLVMPPPSVDRGGGAYLFASVSSVCPRLYEQVSVSTQPATRGQGFPRGFYRAGRGDINPMTGILNSLWAESPKNIFLEYPRTF